MDPLTHPVAIARFLEEQGFDFEFYEKWGYNYLEIGGLRFDDGIGILASIYELVYRIQEEKITDDVVTDSEPPFNFGQTSYSELEKLERETNYLNEIGLSISITDKPVLTRLGPFHYPRIETPVFVSALGWDGVIEYETAKSFIGSLYSGFSKIA